MNQFRALFPKWSFFDRVASPYILEIKIQEEWQHFQFDQKRTWYSLFVNPDLNLALAQVNLLEHFIQDPSEVNFKIIQSLVHDARFRILSDGDIVFDSGILNG
jgi:hypothetical protein